MDDCDRCDNGRKCNCQVYPPSKPTPCCVYGLVSCPECGRQRQLSDWQVVDLREGSGG